MTSHAPQDLNQWAKHSDAPPAATFKVAHYQLPPEFDTGYHPGCSQWRRTLNV